MDDLPYHIPGIFLGVVVTVFGFLYFMVAKATDDSSRQWSTIVAILLSFWLALTGILAQNGFFLQFSNMPPRFLIAILPPFFIILLTIALPSWRNTVRQIPITSLTYLHIVRVPVEIFIWWVFLEGYMPEIMTFEGKNLDIIMGISAPFAAIFLVGFKAKNRYGAIGWNIIGLLLLTNVVAHAILSTPFPFQQFGFEQPNVAVFYFPYIWLPAFIVPAVLFCHVASLVQLLKNDPEL